MKIINFAEQNTIINRYVAELRDVVIQRDRQRFRRNLERIGEAMAFEISKTLNYSTKFVETPLGTATASTEDDRIVIATVFRAGLPLHTGFLNVFDHADNAFVSAYRYYRDKECREVDVRIEYIATPDLTGRTLMLVDPMLATGESMELAYQAFVTKGQPGHTHLCAVIASEQGVKHLQKVFGERPDITLWCAAIDPELNAQSYIVPGLGDAGDLAFGEKL
jgi:uracil phosphoribosyltransferase